MATNLSKSPYYGNTVFSKNERGAHRKADRAAAPYLLVIYKTAKKFIFERLRKKK